MNRRLIWTEVKPKLLFLFLFCALSLHIVSVTSSEIMKKFDWGFLEPGMQPVAKALFLVTLALGHSIIYIPVLFLFSKDRRRLAVLAALPIGRLSLALHRYGAVLTLIGIPLTLSIALSFVLSLLANEAGLFTGAFKSISYASAPLAIIAFFQLIMSFISKSPTGLALLVVFGGVIISAIGLLSALHPAITALISACLVAADIWHFSQRRSFV